MRHILITLCLVLLGSQAAALSCLRPDPVETFQRLAAAPGSYFVIHGKLTFDEAALDTTGTDFDNPENPAPVPGQFVGQGLSKAGFVTPYISNVLLQVTCAGPWCGSARSGVKAVYFVPSSPPPVTLQAGPCGGMIFYEPTPAVLDMLTTCMQGGRCTPLPFE